MNRVAVTVAADAIDRLLGWQHLVKYGDQSIDWMDRVRHAIANKVIETYLGELSRQEQADQVSSAHRAERNINTMNFRVEKDLPKARAAVRENPVDWEGAKQALIENEGQWVLVAENVHASTGEQLRKGKYATFPANEVDDYEFTARKPEKSGYAARRTDIWGRYSKPKGKR